MLIEVSDIPVEVLRQAARRREVVEAMAAFYEEADHRIAQRPGTCWNRAACCRFAEYGHRLHVTALEVVYYLATGGPARQVIVDACPHAYDRKCHARDRRPLGCRIFYCDPAARYWQGPLTEELLARLKEMHVELGVPYFYADWVTVLRACANYE